MIPQVYTSTYRSHQLRIYNYDTTTVTYQLATNPDGCDATLCVVAATRMCSLSSVWPPSEFYSFRCPLRHWLAHAFSYFRRSLFVQCMQCCHGGFSRYKLVFIHHEVSEGQADRCPLRPTYSTCYARRRLLCCWAAVGVKSVGKI